MNEKIFEFLRTKFSELGLSRDILSGFADLLAASVTDESGIEAAVETIRPLLELQQKEADRIRQKYAEQRKKEEQPDERDKKGDSGDKKGEEGEGKGERKPKQDKVAPQKGEDEIPEWAKKIMKDFGDFKAQQKNRDRAVEIGNRRKEITKLVSKLPKPMQSAYDRMDLDIDDADYDSLKTEISSEVDEVMKELSTRRAVFNPPYAGQGNGVKEMSKETADEIAKSLAGN